VAASAEVRRINNGRLDPVAASLSATGMVETQQREIWLSGTGITRVASKALLQRPAQDEPLDYESFGVADGMASPQSTVGHPNSTLTRDGKLWVATMQGLAMMDLPHLTRTARKPSIYVEEVIVGRNTQFPGHALVLPAGTHHVELQFDTIEISSPEKIRLQYRLDGVDSEWLDAAYPARATYSNIPPGAHAFHIRACNRDGIWDRAGTVYMITQLPYFYQTRVFQFGSGALLILLLASAYRFRLRQESARIKVRLEERVAERERIARDLHDTLLQTFQGLMLHLEVVNQLLPEGKAKAELTKSLGHADRAIAEGRSAVYDLRSSAIDTSDLPVSIKALGDELAVEGAATFRLVIEGSPRKVQTMVRDELYRITREALRNAFHHAHARHIETEITYSGRAFLLRIRDDGEGIPPEILEQGRPGHYGLPGMRERAKQIGGELVIWSGASAGTEIEFSIAASIAYGTSPDDTLFHRFRRKQGDR
jgi:signal transduction histidine kinase